MEYLIGVVLAFAVGGSATVIGLDRGRGFYPTVLIVIATYYVLFAVEGASGRTLGLEIAVASGFSALAILGFKRNLWLVAAALGAHGLFDFVHHLFIENPWRPALVAWVLSGVRWRRRRVAGAAHHDALAQADRTGPR